MWSEGSSSDGEEMPTARTVNLYMRNSATAIGSHVRLDCKLELPWWRLDGCVCNDNNKTRLKERSGWEQRYTANSAQAQRYRGLFGGDDLTSMGSTTLCSRCSSIGPF